LIDADALSQSFADTCPPSLSASGPLARRMSLRMIPARLHAATHARAGAEARALARQVARENAMHIR